MPLQSLDKCRACNSWGHLLTISLYCSVVRQDVALGLHIQHVDIVVGQVDDPYPTAGRINDYWGG